MKRTCIFFLVLTLPLVTCAASFDCKKARSYVEHQICDDAYLSKLDTALGANYKNLMRAQLSDVQSENISLQEEEWLKERNQCKTKSCIVTQYEAQVDSLCDLAKDMLLKPRPQCTHVSQLRD